MSEQVKNMINALDKDDHIEAETQFKSALVDKVGTALDDRRKDLAKTFVRTGDITDVDSVQPTEQSNT
jgi:hypothetical protein